jgi:hypothetical protein
VISHEGRLDEMKVEYAEMVRCVNSHSVYELLAKISELEEQHQRICSKDSKHPVFAKLLAGSSTSVQIAYIQNLIHTKGIFEELKHLEKLMKDEEALFRIFEL